MQYLRHLINIVCPEKMMVRRARTIIRNDRDGKSLLHGINVPELSGGQVEDHHFLVDGEFPRRGSNPIKEWAPKGGGLPAVQSLEDHGDGDAIVPVKSDLFAPMWVKQRIVIEPDGASDQFAESGVRPGSDCREDAAEIIGEFARPEGESGDDAEAAATTAFEAPE